MLNRRRRHQTPTFLEGTPGLYVRRESPPRVPSTAPIPTKGDVTPRSGGGQSNASRSLSGSHSSLVHGGNSIGITRKAVLPLGASTPALATSALYASATSIATTTAVPLSGGDADPLPTINNFSSVQNFAHVPSLQSNYRQLSNVPQLHTQLQQRGNNNSANNNNNGRSVALSNPDDGQRQVAARRELSSHSFNNPPSTSWTAARSATAVTAVRPIPLHTSARKNSSADASENAASVKYRQNSRRRHLATSLSFGNVTESLREVDNRPYVPNGVAVAKLSRVNTTARFDNMLRQKSVTSAGSTVTSQPKGRTASGPFSSTSLQSLPGSSILREPSVVSSSCVMPSPTTSQQLQHHVRLNSGSSGNDPESELELPPNWEVEVTPDGIRYYVDHNNRRTHWIHPLASENLSPGWIKIFDPEHGVVYYNEIEKRSQFEHPGLATQSVHFNSYYNGTLYRTNSQLHQSQILEEYPPGVMQEPIDNTPKAAEEDLNIIDDKDVPEWVRLYSEAPFESDHLLDWKMFDVSQLEEFDQMLMKLFKQDAINTVIKYERPRREINDALMARDVV